MFLKDELTFSNTSPSDQHSLRSNAEARLEQAHSTEMPIRSDKELRHELGMHQIDWKCKIKHFDNP